MIGKNHKNAAEEDIPNEKENGGSIWNAEE